MSPDIFDADNPPDDEDDEEIVEDDDAPEVSEPAPATWAGRQAWSGLPDDEDPEDADEEADEELRSRQA